jgi:hypothetical protein
LFIFPRSGVFQPISHFACFLLFTERIPRSFTADLRFRMPIKAFTLTLIKNVAKHSLNLIKHYRSSLISHFPFALKFKFSFSIRWSTSTAKTNEICCKFSVYLGIYLDSTLMLCIATMKGDVFSESFFNVGFSQSGKHERIFFFKQTGERRAWQNPSHLKPFGSELSVKMNAKFACSLSFQQT